ncbi:hypothetical protein [Falsiruegeria mediterranea]|uniref:hypothetical protein n=1 Tax=Falsiruegeria mediterranea TaxID=1280832 RepID=UPI0015F27F97|nr:hypothetical protein [Falsiruegeria mediterranea]
MSLYKGKNQGHLVHVCIWRHPFDVFLGLKIMTGISGQNAGFAQLPEAVRVLQRQLERLYLSRSELERELQELRATQPLMLTRPPRPSLLVRILMRISKRLRQRHCLDVLRQSELFDAAWYLKTYEDVRTAGMDPALHYLHNGASDLRNPGPHFDTEHYLTLYPDIRDNKMNPLFHYMVAGFDEKRSIRPGMPVIPDPAQDKRNV